MPKPAPEPDHCELFHDLNNSLGVIVGRAEALADLLANDAKALQHVSAILRIAKSMADEIRAQGFRPE